MNFKHWPYEQFSESAKVNQHVTIFPHKKALHESYESYTKSYLLDTNDMN